MEFTAENFSKGIWNTVLEYLNTQLLRIGENDKSIVITVGLVLLMVVALVVTRVVLKLVYKILTRKLNSDEKLRFSGVYNFVSYLIYLLVFVSILSSSGVDISIILAATAVLFIGLGLAMRELFQDIIGGLYIIIDKSILAGDVIELNGVIGKVVDIKLRTSRITTRDDKILVVPNHIFINEAVFNYSQTTKRIRQRIRVTVPHDSDKDLIEQLLLQSAETNSEVLKHPAPLVLLEKFSENGLQFSLVVYINDSFKEPTISSNIRKEILRLFNEHKITLSVHRIQLQENTVNRKK